VPTATGGWHAAPRVSSTIARRSDSTRASAASHSATSATAAWAGADGAGDGLDEVNASDAHGGGVLGFQRLLAGQGGIVLASRLG
jgi:hypothetical protein